MPIFAICDPHSELATIVAKMKFGVYVEAWDMSLLVNQMVKFLKKIEGVSHAEVRRQQDKSLLEMFSVDDLISNIICE